MQDISLITEGQSHFGGFALCLYYHADTTQPSVKQFNLRSEACDEALKQIVEKNYAFELLSNGYEKIAVVSWI